jgi:glycosyltransferase involved in cell wall biosynthesis
MSNKAINVLHVSTPKSWRGGEQQLAYLYEELQSKNITQFILCRKGGELALKGKAKGWNIIESEKVTAVDVNFARKIKVICKEHGIDLVHTHDSHAHTFAILSASIWGSKTPIVVSRRVDFAIKPTWFSRFKYNHPLVKKILCVSEAIKEITSPDIKDKTILKTIHSGIDISRFKDSKKSLNILRKEFNIAPETKIIGNVAAIAPHKDYYTFVNTVRILVNQGKDYHFFIIGTGPLEKEIKKYVESMHLNKHITFTGFRSDIPKILPELDAFLITSETEGLGTSVIDAFVCKVPVIATKAGGIPELVIHKKTGLLADVKDAEALADNVELLFSGSIDIKEIIKNQQELLKQFTKEATAEKSLKEYYSIL